MDLAAGEVEVPVRAPSESALEVAPLAARHSSIEGVDGTQALHNVGGQPKAQERVVRSLVTNYARGMPELLGPMPVDAVPLWTARCHSMRGACSAIGAIAMVRDLIGFEQSLRTRDPDGGDLSASARQLQDDLLHLVGRLQTVFGQHSACWSMPLAR